jgi:hypothetical protein
VERCSVTPGWLYTGAAATAGAATPFEQGAAHDGEAHEGAAHAGAQVGVQQVVTGSQYIDFWYVVTGTWQQRCTQLCTGQHWDRS